MFFAIKECLLNIKRSLFMNMVSIITISISLILLGFFGILSFNVFMSIKAMHEKVDMEAYLIDDLNEIQRLQILSFLEQIPGIKSVAYLSKDDAILEGKINTEYISLLDSNPLPASFKLQFREGYRNYTNLRNMAIGIKQFKEVEDVVYGKEWIKILDNITQTFVLIDILLGVLICLASLFVVSNTTRLALSNRRDDIEILKMIGATPGMIRRPFIYEGLLQGFLGGGCAAAVLYWGLESLNIHLFIQLAMPEREMFAVVIVMGMLLGYCGTKVSTIRLLRY